MSDQTYAFVRLAKLAGTVEKRRDACVVKSGVFFKLNFVLPGRGENLGRLFGARCAGMDEEFGKNMASGERLRDPPRVGAAALGQLARVIVAPNGRGSALA